MNSLSQLAETVAREVEPIGGNNHPMPVSATMECEDGTCYWVVCISIRNARTEFTTESEHAVLETAMKNALRGVRAKVNDLVKRKLPEHNKIIRSDGGRTTPRGSLVYLLTGEYHSSDFIRDEPGDVGIDALSIMDHLDGN